MGCINSTNKPLYALNRDDIFNASVVRVQTDRPMALARHGFLEITPHALTFVAPEEEPVAWALQHLRRYGLNGNLFSFEVGRRCPTGPGIYTFRCCNADQFYVKFQRNITSMSAAGDRSNSIHPSHLFGRMESHHTNHYLEPTSVQVNTPLDELLVNPESLSNDSNNLNLNSPDSVQSVSLTAEIIHFPLSASPYSNVNPNSHISSNIYMEQPIRINNEHNNNLTSNEIDASVANHYKTVLGTICKSSSLDVPPDEFAPILNTNSVESQRLYENIGASSSTPFYTSQNNCNNSAERSYANVELIPKLETHKGESKSCQLEAVTDQPHQHSSNDPIVNYIILDLDHPRSPSQCSPKNEYGSRQSLSGSRGNIASFKKDELPATAISCGSSTMPKGSTISDDSSKFPNNKMESSGSYTRIDFLKTFALMKSSTNYADFDFENDQESRITRHSKFVRKAYSISE